MQLPFIDMLQITYKHRPRSLTLTFWFTLTTFLLVCNTRKCILVLDHIILSHDRVPCDDIISYTSNQLLLHALSDRISEFCPIYYKCSCMLLTNNCCLPYIFITFCKNLIVNKIAYDIVFYLQMVLCLCLTLMGPKPLFYNILYHIPICLYHLCCSAVSTQTITNYDIH
jgi:hypothetical protein